eukprot:jgi/Chrzof1/4993/Cz15g07220.t1
MNPLSSLPRGLSALKRLRILEMYYVRLEGESPRTSHSQLQELIPGLYVFSNAMLPTTEVAEWVDSRLTAVVEQPVNGDQDDNQQPDPHDDQDNAQQDTIAANLDGAAVLDGHDAAEEQQQHGALQQQQQQHQQQHQRHHGFQLLSSSPAEHQHPTLDCHLGLLQDDTASSTSAHCPAVLAGAGLPGATVDVNGLPSPHDNMLSAYACVDEHEQKIEMETLAGIPLQSEACHATVLISSSSTANANCSSSCDAGIAGEDWNNVDAVAAGVSDVAMKHARGGTDTQHDSDWLVCIDENKDVIDTNKMSSDKGKAKGPSCAQAHESFAHGPEASGSGTSSASSAGCMNATGLDSLDTSSSGCSSGDAGVSVHDDQDARTSGVLDTTKHVSQHADDDHEYRWTYMNGLAADQDQQSPQVQAMYARRRMQRRMTRTYN